jgi:hypothetical protein
MTKPVLFVLGCACTLLVAGAYWIGWTKGQATAVTGVHYASHRH